MKDIKLLKLTLRNYRNIGFATYDFSGKSMKIVGDNRIGKTNTLEAIYFLLTDKLLNGSSDISAIKPLDDTKKVVAVEGEFQVGDKVISLAKEFQEEWVKMRGKEDVVFKGHSTTYYYNGVKQGTLKQYNELFYEDFGLKDNRYVDLIRMSIDPYYLAELGESNKWTDLRQFIVSIIGDITNEDIFNRDSRLLLIKDDLYACGERTDQLKKRYTNDINSYLEEIIGCDANIKRLEATTCPSEEDVIFAERNIKQIDDDIATLKNSDKTSEQVLVFDKKITELKAVINNITQQEIKKLMESPEDEQKAKLRKQIEEEHSKLTALIKPNSELKSEIFVLEREINILQRELDKLTDNRTSLINELKTLDEDLKKAKEEEHLCPTCLQPVPYEDYAKTMLEQREKIIAQGKINKSDMEEHEEEIKARQDKIADLNAKAEKSRSEIDTCSKRIDELQLQLDSIPAKNREIDTTLIKPYEEELKKVEKDRVNFLNEANEKGNILRARIYELENQKSVFEKVIDNKKYYDRQMEELEVVKAEKKVVNRKYVETEQKKDLVNIFLYTKLKMLDENVSKVFGNDIKFQLIKENINGGYDAVCKFYIKGTNTLWKSGSKSERVITGIAVADKIKEQLHLSNLPYLFDEGGEISRNTFTDLIKTDSQIICVEVKDNLDKPTLIPIIK